MLLLCSFIVCESRFYCHDIKCAIVSTQLQSDKVALESLLKKYSKSPILWPPACRRTGLPSRPHLARQARFGGLIKVIYPKYYKNSKNLVHFSPRADWTISGVHRDWSRKFETGLNIIIGIVQNDPPMSTSFWQKKRLVTLIHFELFYHDIKPSLKFWWSVSMFFLTAVFAVDLYKYSCNKITKTWIQISHQHLFGFFS